MDALFWYLSNQIKRLLYTFVCNLSTLLKLGIVRVAVEAEDVVRVFRAYSDPCSVLVEPNQKLVNGANMRASRKSPAGETCSSARTHSRGSGSQLALGLASYPVHLDKVTFVSA